MASAETICGPYGIFLKADYHLIMAIGQDAANRAMDKRCAQIASARKREKARAWTDDEYNLCADKVDALARHAALVYAETGGSMFLSGSPAAIKRQAKARGRIGHNGGPAIAEAA